MRDVTTASVERQSFQCWYCGPCDISILKKDTLKKNGSGKCNPCHAEYSRNYHLVQKAKKNPENCMDCDDCDRIFSRFEPGYFVHKPRPSRNKCPFCNSKNISPYIKD